MAQDQQKQEIEFFPEVRAVAKKLGFDLNTERAEVQATAKELRSNLKNVESGEEKDLRCLALIDCMRKELSESYPEYFDMSHDSLPATKRYLDWFKKHCKLYEPEEKRRPFDDDGILWPPEGKKEEYKSAFDHAMTFALVDSMGVPAELWYKKKQRKAAESFGLYPSEMRRRRSLEDPSVAIALLEVLDKSEAEGVVNDNLSVGAAEYFKKGVSFDKALRAFKNGILEKALDRLAEVANDQLDERRMA
ncbi:MAG: hypothetical protein Q4C41_08015 [Eggerthellaceae bacterium]|nr:hypothetical protein [Eggerthellaceae bacterium]